MPRYNVEADGEWACFSSVCDGFITHFMPLDNYERWRTEEYGKQKTSLEDANRMTLRECLFSLGLNHTDEQIVRNLREVGLMHDKSKDD
jgi:hypothetical protein